MPLYTKRNFLKVVASFLVTSYLPSFAKVKEKRLFNGRNFKGWYIFLDKMGKNNDPNQVFKITKEGYLHISGETFGFLGTVKEYKNYKLKADFKWGINKYPPRVNDKRDSGICYHVPLNAKDEIWPTLIEFQVQEGDCGDIWLVGDLTYENDGNRTTPKNYFQIVKSKNLEKSNGEWNQIEIIVKDGDCQHFLNGSLVNELKGCSITKGKILFQSEGAEIFYRNITILEL